MSGSPTSPSGGGSGGRGGLFSGFLKQAARSVFESAMNSTVSANNTSSASSSSGVVTSRSFFGLGGDSPDSGSENQVVEYYGRSANEEIASVYAISLRAGDLILHAHSKSTDPSSTSYPPYNIILHSTHANSTVEKMFSLYRTTEESEASRIFVIYKQIFPDLVKASTTPLDRGVLEKIIKLSKKHESYTAVHIAAALNMVEQLRSPVLREKLPEQEGNLLHTPLHVAAVSGKLEAFSVIAEDDRIFNRVYDYVDLKGNSVVHLAAECKDKSVGVSILKLLKQKLQGLSGEQRSAASRLLLELFQKLNNEGYAPIHMACMNYNTDAVELMIDLVGHLIAETSMSDEDNDDIEMEELTSVLVLESPQSPSKSPSNLLDLRAPSTGNTPLHLSTSNPPLLTHLLQLGSDPNIPDNDGVTPLHKAVMAAHLNSTLQLLSNFAYPDFKATFQTYNNAAPIHIAAKLGVVDCLKALIIFGADIDAVDGYGHTARHIVATIFSGNNAVKQDALFVLAAAGAKRCPSGVSGGCSDACKVGGKNNGKTPEGWKIQKDGTTPPGAANSPSSILHDAMRGLSIVKESFESGMRQSSDDKTEEGPTVGGILLSLDGGGIRGLVLTQMLFFMEKEFGNGDVPIVSFFDWVAGTSTGGILALALACGKSVLETQSLYIKLKDKVFTGDRPYSAATMEEFLKKEFGPDRKMSSFQKPKVMIMTSLANRRPPDLYIFRNYMSPSCLLGDPEEFTQFPDETYVWETAKVTGAAPSYFTLDNEIFIDGGLISNNPTLDALTELGQFKAVMMSSQQNISGNSNGWKLPSLVVSLGTGIPPRVHCSATNLDIAWPTGVFDAIKNVPRLSQLVHLLVDQATQAEGQVVERARAWCTSIGVPFFRFSPEMSADIDLDEKRDDVLVNLMWETWCYMVGNREVVKELYERLKDISRTRSPVDQSMETQ
ncbi:85/88 kDa calcium-independent phospholipase A2 [Orchesella cincta]|uniref:phospholipase A2 n=1 Tax=Orchesella cincta TaxID=48709 RepID=A0A1D2M8H7_ORCCI|nr:85/88 kDa calcium-independent phospholipase A2 [Orchesella cincta]